MIRRLQELLGPSVIWQRLSAPHVATITANFDCSIDIDSAGYGWIRWRSVPEKGCESKPEWVEYTVFGPEGDET